MPPQPPGVTPASSTPAPSLPPCDEASRNSRTRPRRVSPTPISIIAPPAITPIPYDRSTPTGPTGVANAVVATSRDVAVAPPTSLTRRPPTARHVTTAPAATQTPHGVRSGLDDGWAVSASAASVPIVEGWALRGPAAPMRTGTGARRRMWLGESVAIAIGASTTFNANTIMRQASAVMNVDKSGASATVREAMLQAPRNPTVTSEVACVGSVVRVSVARALGRLVRIHLPPCPASSLTPVPSAVLLPLGSSCVAPTNFVDNNTSATHGARNTLIAIGHLRPRRGVGAYAKAGTKAKSEAPTHPPPMAIGPNVADGVDVRA